MKKKWAAIWIAGLLAVSLAGCGKKEEPAPEPETAQETAQETQDSAEVQESEPEPEFAVIVTDTMEQEERDEEDQLLLTYQYNRVEVTIPGNDEAQNKINDFFVQEEVSYQDTIREYVQFAREDLEMRKEDPEWLESWVGYSVGREYSIMRADEKIISVVMDCYEYTGGAHPNSVRVAYTFDTQTGEKLSLEAVVKDLDEVQSMTTEFLTEQLAEQEQEEGMLFDDYKSYIQDILTDNTWYLDQEGFHIIINEYIVSPHAAGIQEMTMPYDEYDLIKSEYLM